MKLNCELYVTATHPRDPKFNLVKEPFQIYQGYEGDYYLVSILGCSKSKHTVQEALLSELHNHGLDLLYFEEYPLQEVE